MIAKYTLIALLISALAIASKAGKTSIRGLQDDSYECILMEMAEDFGEEESIYEHMCLGPDQYGDFDNIYHLDDNFNTIDKILEENNVDLFESSGRYKIVLTKVMISETQSSVTLSGDTTAQLIDLGVTSSRRLGQTTGNRKVVVFRVTEAGSNNLVSSSASELASKWTGGGENSMAGRYNACSKGKLTFSAGTGAVNGYDDIEITTPISGASATTIQNAVWQAIKAKHSINRGSYNHVIIVLPSGTNIGGNTNWLAYAEVGNIISVYNNQNAMFISNQVHEIGHNLGLRHSGEGSLSYGDQSGVMGYGHAQLNSPRQCFNAAKTWQMGWFDDKSTTVQPSSTPFTAYLDATVDYSSGLPSDEYVLFKVDNNYIIYNRKKGINNEVRADGDMVTISQMSSEGQESWKQAALSAGGTHQLGSATVEVCEFLEVGGVSKAKVSIYTGGNSGCSTNLEPTSPPTNAPVAADPVTPAPVIELNPTPAVNPTPADGAGTAATPAPVVAPTRAPTRSPTRQPVQVNVPVPDPTAAPVVEPTNAPVLPTLAPISPTLAPVTPDLCPDGQMKIDITIKTDNKPNETSWELIQYRGEVIDSDQYSISDKLRQFEYAYCVPMYDTYEFRLSDAGNDGISSIANGQGFYIIEVNGEVYSEGGMFASEEIDYIVEPCSYEADESQRYKNFQFVFDTGDEPQQISWDLSPTPYGGGPWLSRNSSIHWVENMCLDSTECYTLDINSASGNGFVGNGYYELNWDLENIGFSAGGSFSTKSVQFGNCTR